MPDTAAELHPWLAIDLDRAQRVTTQLIAAYTEQVGAQGVVLGLSGGIDSAVTAALATEALGVEAVDALFLPGPTSSQDDQASAREVADHLGLALTEATIAPAAEALEAEVGLEADRVLVGNLQARLRMALLYARAKARDRLVLGTGNKSELLTGYFTKHGDGGVDLEPVGDLYKTQLRTLAQRLELPQRVIERPPTAGLWRGQRDEEELGMPYRTLDLVLAGLERQHAHGRIATEADTTVDEVARVQQLVTKSAHKRNPPPVAKLGWRTPLVDWREPTS